MSRTPQRTNEADPAVPEDDGSELSTLEELESFLDDDADTLDADVDTSSGGPGADEIPEGEPPSDSEDGDEGTTESHAEAPTEAPKEEEPAPTPEPSLEGTPQAEPPVETPASTPPEAGTEPSPQPQATEPVETPEELQARYHAWRTASEEQLAEHYAISEDMAAELNDDPDSAIPKIAARVYLDAFTNSVAHMQRMLPSMLEQALAARDANTQYEEQFFTQWPALREHTDVVTRLGDSYRQMYPGATPEEFMRDVGAQAMVALRLPTEPIPPAPAAEPAPTPAPHRPAASSPPASAPVRAPSNPFEALDQEFDTEDLDVD